MNCFKFSTEISVENLSRAKEITFFRTRQAGVCRPGSGGGGGGGGGGAL